MEKEILIIDRTIYMEALMFAFESGYKACEVPMTLEESSAFFQKAAREYIDKAVKIFKILEE